LELLAILDTSNIEKDKKKPVLIILHGGFSVGYWAINNCQSFIDKGFIVFAPSYRGENGNDGHYELMLGEVDDAKAAVNWIANQPFANTDSIFVFGHSVGGGIALSLSLHNDVPIAKTGSCDGLYDYGTMEYWSQEKNRVPFDHENHWELYFRLPVYALDYMVRSHSLYIGIDDYYKEKKEFYISSYPKQDTKLDLFKVKGDHFSSLRPALEEFLKEITN
jgi:pimeloyl-ACP methyl ester carboxylesterase